MLGCKGREKRLLFGGCTRRWDFLGLEDVFFFVLFKKTCEPVLQFTKVFNGKERKVYV